MAEAVAVALASLLDIFVRLKQWCCDTNHNDIQLNVTLLNNKKYTEQ